MVKESEKVVIENINTPGRTERVDKHKYIAMRDALLKVLPKKPPGITVAEAKEKLIPLLPQDLFPGGAKSGWWLKSAQLDLEAKGKIQRVAGRPMRIHRL